MAKSTKKAPDESRVPEWLIKYDPKYCAELIKYFSVLPYELRKVSKVMSTGDVKEIEIPVANDLPSFSGFAIRIGVDRDTLLNWTKQYPEWKQAYKLAKSYQENFVAVNGAKGLIDSRFGIVIAKNFLNWKEKVETTKKVKIDPDKLKKMSPEEIKAFMAEILNEMGDDE